MTREEAMKEWVIPALKHTWNEKVNKKVLEALNQEPKMEVCPSCGLDVHSDFKFCPRCGAKMESEDKE